MAIIHNPDSEYSREMAQWNTQKRHGGKNANGHEPFPDMLYKAFARDNGKVMCGDPLAAVGDPVGEAFARSCQLTVGNAEERDRALAQGWSVGPVEAIEKYEKDMRSIPKRDKSYALPIVAMNSIPQQEVANGSGQTELARASPIALSNVVNW